MLARLHVNEDKGALYGNSLFGISRLRGALRPAIICGCANASFHLLNAKRFFTMLHLAACVGRCFTILHLAARAASGFSALRSNSFLVAFSLSGQIRFRNKCGGMDHVTRIGLGQRIPESFLLFEPWRCRELPELKVW